MTTEWIWKDKPMNDFRTPELSSIDQLNKLALEALRKIEGTFDRDACLDAIKFAMKHYAVIVKGKS